MQRPSVANSILISTTEAGYLAYDTKADALHELNPVAALILELCNGERSVSEIALLAEPYLKSGAIGAVSEWIVEASDAGILVDGVSEVPSGESESTESGHEALDAPKLLKLAERLRENGKVKTAWLCQQRAVELSPDDVGALRELGELSHILGRRSDARDAYTRYLELSPDDAEIQHLLSALSNDLPPERVPDECLQQLYQRFSTFYETNMREELGYSGPEKLFAATEPWLPKDAVSSALDLGCGTGLCAEAFSSRCQQFTGVDISPEMVELARQSELYHELHVSEVTDWLEKCEASFELILACDTFIYFGDLSRVFAAAAKRLSSTGTMAFSVEQSEEIGFQLLDNGRFAHHLGHVDEAATSAGLQVRHHEIGFLRMEYGREVTALFVVLGRG